MQAIKAYSLQSKQTPSLTYDNYFFLDIPKYGAAGEAVNPVPTSPLKSFETVYAEDLLSQLMDKFRHDKMVEKVENMECFKIELLEDVFKIIVQWHKKMITAEKNPLNHSISSSEKSLTQLINENGVLDTNRDGRSLISDVHQRKQLIILFDNALVNMDERHKLFLSLVHATHMEIIAGTAHFLYNHRLYTLYQVQYDDRMKALRWIVMYGDLDVY